MNIILLGSGNVATHLGAAFFNLGHTIKQVYSRSEANAMLLANKLNAHAVSDLSEVDQEAELYILSVKDDVLESVITAMPLVSGIVVHTAGSISIDVLQRFDKHGVFYPFQTFTIDSEISFKTVPVLIESNNEALTARLYSMGQELSNTVLKANSYQRGQLHIAAVYACNFVNHMYCLGNEILQKSDLPFSLLHPLISETAAKVQKLPPSETQTGPAVRNDQKIIQKHIAALNDNEELKRIYQLLTGSIINRLNN